MRYAGTGITSNALLGVRELEKYCQLGEAEERLMKRAYLAMGLTARTYHKILRVARTIADMRRAKESGASSERGNQLPDDRQEILGR